MTSTSAAPRRSPTSWRIQVESFASTTPRTVDPSTDASQLQEALKPVRPVLWVHMTNQAGRVHESGLRGLFADDFEIEACHASRLSSHRESAVPLYRMRELAEAYGRSVGADWRTRWRRG